MFAYDFTNHILLKSTTILFPSAMKTTCATTHSIWKVYTSLKACHYNVEYKFHSTGTIPKEYKFQSNSDTFYFLMNLYYLYWYSLVFNAFPLSNYKHCRLHMHRELSYLHMCTELPYLFVAFHCYFQKFRLGHEAGLSNWCQNTQVEIGQMPFDTTQLPYPTIRDPHNCCW